MHDRVGQYAVRDEAGEPVVFYDVDPEGNAVIAGWPVSGLRHFDGDDELRIGRYLRGEPETWHPASVWSYIPGRGYH